MVLLFTHALMGNVILFMIILHRLICVINRYSRKIIWLRIGTTNNDPKVILLYYLSAIISCDGKSNVCLCVSGKHNYLWCHACVIKLYIGVPTLLRSDCGTENSTLAACHMLLRHNHGDEQSGRRSFRYGSSTTNTVMIILII